jgi:phosphoribosylamine--glycine ligase
VKDLTATGDRIHMRFSDRYSIYDWGEMPDAIPGKGAALASTAEWFFTLLGRAGVRTHFLGRDGLTLHGRRFRVVHPVKTDAGYDYTPVRDAGPGRLIPLEMIFRFGVPQGSSLLQASRQRLHELGVDHVTEGMTFDTVKIEASTKLEPADRLLSRREAATVGGLTPQQQDALWQQTAVVAGLLQDHLKQAGLKLWDGKLEFALDLHDNIVLIDSIGIDELRLTRNGVTLSKETLRQCYTGSHWHETLKHEKANPGFRERMERAGVTPAPLPRSALELAARLYAVLADAVTQGASDRELDDLADRVRDLHTPKRVLMIGGGGRERALALKLLESPHVKAVELLGGLGDPYGRSDLHVNEDADSDPVAYATQGGFDLAVVGPEGPLAAGLADTLNAAGVPTVGPGADGARLETSKAFAKDVMHQAGIPTAAHEAFSDPEHARTYLQDHTWPHGVVIKADGLAAGKGVVVCNTRDEAMAAVSDLASGRLTGTPEHRLIVEERLSGPEVSFFALLTEHGFKPLGDACDYKQARDGDRGPNTGGMGTFAPADWVSAATRQQVRDQVFAPLHRELARRGIRYRGVVFAGLMLTEGGPKVLEFNVRFGDPETQSLMPLIHDDLFELLHGTATGTLDTTTPVQLHDLAAVHVVAAAHGYPGTEGTPVRKGDPIDLGGPAFTADTAVYHAGVAAEDGRLVTAGGRVLGVTATAASRQAARRRAYARLNDIHFAGKHHRSDIAAGETR